MALLARGMQTVYAQELERRAQLPDAQRRSHGLDAADFVNIHLVSRRVRLLLGSKDGAAVERHE